MISGEFPIGDITMPTPQAEQSFALTVTKTVDADVDFIFNGTFTIENS